ncbi:hypothetical protein [Asticcacaulis machinosus]|uniref:Restriction endonuclease n=1 Tax=Asticcacaulis machinosus TaxID=2984211 RepID=A0ABT5HJ79_9CAUL|nr:hypothetical protein [Asticcacaulis machinosus]MDC7676297.1 hypothetical protein [Asticcacaulis machinosus]
MTDAERSQEANGIWLCRTCHKKVDDDPNSFSAELLFEWKQSHTRKIADGLGKTDAGFRERADRERLKGFEASSSLARQIVLDKPLFWEYNLTAELLRSGFAHIKFKYEALKQGFYALPVARIDSDDFADWADVQMRNIVNQIEAIKLAGTVGLLEAWGPPGQPGQERDILQITQFIIDAAEHLLKTEEVVRFLKPPSHFEKVQELYIGIAGRQLEELFKIPDWIISKTSDENLAPGDHILKLVFDMPDGWVEQVIKAYNEAVDSA